MATSDKPRVNLDAVPTIRTPWIRRLGADVIMEAVVSTRRGDRQSHLFLRGEGRWRRSLEFWCLACNVDPDVIIEQADRVVNDTRITRRNVTSGGFVRRLEVSEAQESREEPGGQAAEGEGGQLTKQDRVLQVLQRQASTESEALTGRELMAAAEIQTGNLTTMRQNLVAKGWDIAKTEGRPARFWLRGTLSPDQIPQPRRKRKKGKKSGSTSPAKTTALATKPKAEVATPPAPTLTQDGLAQVIADELLKGKVNGKPGVKVKRLSVELEISFDRDED